MFLLRWPKCSPNREKFCSARKKLEGTLAAMIDYYAMIKQECVHIYEPYLFLLSLSQALSVSVRNLCEGSYKIKRSKDDSIKDSDDPDIFSAFTPSQKKPDTLNYSRSKFSSGLNKIK